MLYKFCLIYPLKKSAFNYAEYLIFLAPILNLKKKEEK